MSQQPDEDPNASEVHLSDEASLLKHTSVVLPEEFDLSPRASDRDYEGQILDGAKLGAIRFNPTRPEAEQWTELARAIRIYADHHVAEARVAYEREVDEKLRAQIVKKKRVDLGFAIGAAATIAGLLAWAWISPDYTIQSFASGLAVALVMFGKLLYSSLTEGRDLDTGFDLG